jgi:riboflavin synthase
LFTGIIEETGAVRAVERRDNGARIEIDAAVVLSDLEIGGSIAVNGCCLTAVVRYCRPAVCRDILSRGTSTPLASS